jgi:ubiquinone/menaquinone biosynthesis C-methylase UbiE
MAQSSYFKYDNHQSAWDKVLSNAEDARLAQTWFQTETLDSWRHDRMRQPLRSIISTDVNASWLTVGDGRFGTDAHWIINAGAQHVHASDISETLLKIGSEKGFIADYSAQNAESLSFKDRSFDYIYCKEALHHFPRPYMALYEMFRVAKKGVILTEPRDQVPDRGPLAAMIYGFKSIFLRKREIAHTFEPVGNYVHSISERELDKFLLGMHYTYVAYAGCNDEYVEGVEFLERDPALNEGKKIKSKILKKIRRMNLYNFLGITKTGVLTAALFKDVPDASLLEQMQKAGWEVRRLPLNPYLDKNDAVVTR